MLVLCAIVLMIPFVKKRVLNYLNRNNAEYSRVSQINSESNEMQNKIDNQYKEKERKTSID